MGTLKPQQSPIDSMSQGSLIVSHSCDLTPEGVRDLFVNAELRFKLSPTQMAQLLLGDKDSYGTYKKWVTKGGTWHRPAASVLQHIATLQSWLDSDPEAVAQYIKTRLSKN